MRGMGVVVAVPNAAQLQTILAGVKTVQVWELAKLKYWHLVTHLVPPNWIHLISLGDLGVVIVVDFIVVVVDVVLEVVVVDVVVEVVEVDVVVKVVAIDVLVEGVVVGGAVARQNVPQLVMK